jgi:hypothetical protein
VTADFDVELAYTDVCQGYHWMMDDNGREVFDNVAGAGDLYWKGISWRQ